MHMRIPSIVETYHLQEKQFSSGKISKIQNAIWSLRLFVFVTLNLPPFLYSSVTMDSVITVFKSMHVFTF